MNEIIRNLKKIAVLAGKAVLDVKLGEVGIEYKADESPVTTADLASNEVIISHLKSLYPEIPILSEEGSSVAFEERKRWDKFFLIDPLDGTKEFIKDNGEYCICIALMEFRKPILGVIYVPEQDKLYYGLVGKGAYVESEGQKEVKICTKKPEKNEVVKCVGSRSHPSPDLEWLMEKYNVQEVVPCGSAIKFCKVADGTAHIYLRTGPTMEWDTGAGQAILEAAGGTLHKIDGSEFLYNKEILKNEGFIAKA